MVTGPCFGRSCGVHSWGGRRPPGRPWHGIGGGRVPLASMLRPAGRVTGAGGFRAVSRRVPRGEPGPAPPCGEAGPAPWPGSAPRVGVTWSCRLVQPECQAGLLVASVRLLSFLWLLGPPDGDRKTRQVHRLGAGGPAAGVRSVPPPLTLCPARRLRSGLVVRRPGGIFVLCPARAVSRNRTEGGFRTLSLLTGVPQGTCVGSVRQATSHGSSRPPAAGYGGGAVPSQPGRAERRCGTPVRGL